jgi:hypothetical protein
MTLQFTTAVLFCLVFASAQAEITPGAAVVPNVAATFEKSPGDGPASESAKELTTEEKLLREHLAQGEQAAVAANARAAQASARLQTGVVPSNAKISSGQSGNGESGNWATSLIKTLRDFVKPAKQNDASIDVLQPVKQLDSVLPKKREAEVELPSAITPVAGDPGAGARQGDRFRQDRAASGRTVQEMLDELRPWAWGIGALALLVFLLNLGWNFLRWKNARKIRRRVSKKSRNPST